MTGERRSASDPHPLPPPSRGGGVLKRFMLSQTARQFFKFGLVGLAGFVVDWGMLHVGIDRLGLGRIAAAFFSFPFAVMATWLGNRLYTFRGARHMPMGQQLVRFAMICFVGLVFNRGTYSLLVEYVPLAHQFPVLGLLGGTCAGMFFNFFASRKHVFGH